MTGSGTALDPYVIWDVNDLQDMNLVLGAYYDLGQDIDASPTATWNWNAVRGVYEGFVPIGDHATPWRGYLNGRDKAIRGLHQDRYSNNPAELRYGGLFGRVIGDTSIQNLLLLNVNIINHSDQTQGNYVGGLAGRVHPGVGNMLISRVGVTGIVNSTYYSNSTLPHYPHFVGGWVGWLESVRAYESYAYVDVTTRSGAQNSVYAGGFSGSIWGGVIDDCYARGDVIGLHNTNYVSYTGGFLGTISVLDVSRCYSAGLVTNTGLGICHIGGFVANVSVGGNCYHCHWDTQTSGQAASAGGTGNTTAEMKTQGTFTNWNFNTIWGIDPLWNDGYPYLQWVRPDITVVSPNGGEVWHAGSVHTILWTHSFDPGPDVMIELLLSGALDEIIVASTPIGAYGSGSYAWSIDPEKAENTQYQVRITSTTSLSITDTSDDVFRIVNPSPAPAPKVQTLPATGVG